MHKGTWLTRALHVTIALSFILGAFVVAPSVSADPGTSQWEKQLTPNDDDKVILPGSDIIDFDVAGDGKTIYAIGRVDLCATKATTGRRNSARRPLHPGPLSQLWKSVDGGITWEGPARAGARRQELARHGPADAWDDFTFFTPCLRRGARRPQLRRRRRLGLRPGGRCRG